MSSDASDGVTRQPKREWVPMRWGQVRSTESCHVGYRSCFYRRVPVGSSDLTDAIELEFTATEKVFDPAEVYGDAPNPTRL